MLRSLKDLEKCRIAATDGTIGHAHDFYFDDKTWVIRYLVVDTGAWLSNRHVLISPHSINGWDVDGKILPAAITREQVEKSPVIDTGKPVSREHEKSYMRHYGYPYYWEGAGLWGETAYPGMTLRGVAYNDPEAELDAERQQHINSHLRSCNALTHYYLHAADGEIGHVQGYLIDERSWAIRFLIINTSNWWLGHQVLIAPEWIESISWLDSTFTTGLSRHAVKDSPPYDPATPPDPAKEASIYRHYGRRSYGKDLESPTVA